MDNYEKKNEEVLDGVKKIHSGIKEVLAELGDSNLPLANILNEAVWALNKQFPELTESEDERTRKFLLGYVIDMIAGLESDISRSTYDGIKGHDPDAEAELTQWEKARGYLEKRKEQKPRLIGEDSVEKMARQMYETGQTIKEQKSAEWSEEDEKMRDGIIDILNRTFSVYSALGTSSTRPSCPTYKDEIDWLKSLRPQYHGDVTMTEAYKMGKEAGEASHWKPSEEQMEALKKVAYYSPGTDENLIRLYQDLKKL